MSKGKSRRSWKAVEKADCIELFRALWGLWLLLWVRWQAFGSIWAEVWHNLRFWMITLSWWWTIGLEIQRPYRRLLQESRQATEMAWTGLGGSSRGGRMKLDSEYVLKVGWERRIKDHSEILGTIGNVELPWNEMGKTAVGKIRNSTLGTLCFRMLTSNLRNWASVGNVNLFSGAVWPGDTNLGIITLLMKFKTLSSPRE